MWPLEERRKARLQDREDDRLNTDPRDAKTKESEKAKKAAEKAALAAEKAEAKKTAEVNKGGENPHGGNGGGSNWQAPKK